MIIATTIKIEICPFSRRVTDTRNGRIAPASSTSTAGTAGPMRRTKLRGLRSTIGAPDPKHRPGRITIKGSMAITMRIRRNGGITIITETARRVSSMNMAPTSGSSLKKETGKRGTSMPISPSTIAMRTKKAVGPGKENRGIRRGKGRGTVRSMTASAEKAVHRTALRAAGSKQSEANPSLPTANTARMIDIGSMSAGASDRWRSKRKAIVPRR